MPGEQDSGAPFDKAILRVHCVPIDGAKQCTGGPRSSLSVRWRTPTHPPTHSTPTSSVQVFQLAISTIAYYIDSGAPVMRD